MFGDTTNLHIFFSIFLFLSTVKAKETDSFSKVFQKYNSSNLVSMDVSKKVISELLGTEKEQKGKLYFSTEKFRISFFEPRKEVVTFDGRTLWTEQRVGAPNAEKVQVGKLLINEKNKSQIVISILFDKKSFTKNFERVSTVKKNDTLIYNYKSKNKLLNIFNLTFEVVKDEIQKISFDDDVNNRIELQFSNVLFSSEKQPNLFKYAPPAGAEVSIL